MVWVGRDLIDHLVPTTLPWAGMIWERWDYCNRSIYT